MQHARIYRAWLPSEIFSKYGNAVESEKTIANRFQRATKRGKFSRAAWEFDVVLNSIAFYPDSKVFGYFEITQAYLRSAASRVYKGHFKNERVIKPFRKHPKPSKFVCIKSSLQCMHNSYPFYRNSKISRNSSYILMLVKLSTAEDIYPKNM